MQYQCNNSFYPNTHGTFHYNLGEIISESEYNLIPDKYKKWFTEVGKPLHFYCQRLTGGGFDINEWNKAFDEVKDSSREIQKLVLDSPPACKEQCFDCIAIVGERRKATKNL